MTRDPLVAEVFAAIDARDAKRFCDCLADDVMFRFGNAAPVQGRAQVHAMVSHFLDGLADIRHRLDQTWDLGETRIQHGRVTYRRQDGSELSVPFANVWHLHGDRIGEYLIFVDVSSL